MVSQVACWLISLIADSQAARNALFPDGADSPAVAMMALAMSCALTEWLLLEDNLMRAMRCHRLRTKNLRSSSCSGARSYRLDPPRRPVRHEDRRKYKVLFRNCAGFRN
eukprot:s456_g21.t1